MISVILATGNRPRFLAHAIGCWMNQTIVQQSELLIVDDSDTEFIPPSIPNLTYRHVGPMKLGDKLNLAAAEAHGDMIQKWDDDDWYAPTFLETVQAQLASHVWRPRILVGCSAWLFLARDCTLRFLRQTPQWMAGGTLAWYAEAVGSKPFASVPSGVDTQFGLDHPNLRRVFLDNPELYVMSRHGRNTWRKAPNGMDLDEFILTLPVYSKTLAEIAGSAAAENLENLIWQARS